MAYVGNVVEFISAPEAQSTIWHLDPETNEVVTQCVCCKAEARHSEDELTTFSFAHETSCRCFDSYGGRAASSSTESHENEAIRPENDGLKLRNINDKAYDIAFRVARVLEEEPDSSLAFTTLAFVAAVTCDVNATSSGALVDDVADEFLRRFHRLLSDVRAQRTKEGPLAADMVIH